VEVLWRDWWGDKGARVDRLVSVANDLAEFVRLLPGFQGFWVSCSFRRGLVMVMKYFVFGVELGILACWWVY
jgi:hypothetical protein